MTDTSLTHLLDQLGAAGDGDSITVQDILDATVDRSILPVVLAISLLLVSPLSGILGLPTLAAFVILLVMGQALLRREHLWLPAVLRNRQIRRARFVAALAWLRKPAAWIDRHSKPRLQILTIGPLRWVTLVICILVPILWPPLEVLPFATSAGAGAVSLMTFGLFTRDGLYVLMGYIAVGGTVALILWLVQAGT